MLSRRHFIKGATVAGCAVLLNTPVFAARKTVKIGVLAPSHCATPLVYAQTQGLFKKHGVNAEIVYLKDTQDILKGMQRNELDFGQIMGPLVMAASTGAQKLQETPLSATQALGTNGGVLAVSTKSAIKTIGDLKGKTIGVHSPMMVHYLILDIILERSGIDTAKDIKIKVVSMGEMGKSLEEGSIDGFINPEPIPTVLEKKGLSRTLLATKMFWVDHPCCLLTSKRATVQNEKSLVSDLTRASMVAGLILNNKDTRGEAIASIHKASTPFNTLPLPLLLNAFSSERTDFYPFPFQSSGTVIVERMKKEKLLPQGTDTGRLVEDVLLSHLAMETIKEAAKEVPGSAVPQGLTRQEKIHLT